MTPVFDPDRRTLIGRSDLIHRGTITTGTQGLPVANGRFGGPVWQSNGTTMVMQLNHTDVFMFNDASAASHDHRDAGGGAVGRVHVGLGASDVFDEATEQHLSLYDGVLTVAGSGVRVDVVAAMDSDVVAIMITDDRATPEAITVDLAMLRDADQVWGAHTATSRLSSVTGEHPGDNDIAVLDQVIQETCDTGIAVNDFYVSTAVAATVRGRDVAKITDGMISGRATLRMELRAQRGSFTVFVGGAATMQPDRSATATATAIANVTQSDAAGIRTSSRAWWSAFWQKSYVYFPTQLEFERRRTYYLYLAAISNRGAYPSKYNGGIWIGEEDRRDWGSFYWNWNQDSLYQPLMAANQLELMEPMFRMRQSSYEQYRTAARQMWGGQGIFIGETAGVLGWETLPDDIGDDLRDYLSFATETASPELAAFSTRRNRYLPAWNWRVFDTTSQASFVTHTMVATQETAEHFWAAYCYTKDLDWLRDAAYPFIKGAADLYQSFGGLTKEADGKFHFHHTNLHEHIWAGEDVIDDLALARGVFAVVITASELLGVDADRRPRWKEIRDNLADYPLRSDPGALWAASTNPALASQLSTDEPAWAQGLRPAHFIRDLHGIESPILKMLEKFDVLNLETRDQQQDNGEWEIALTTYLHSPGHLDQVENQVVDRNGSSRFHVDAARLGRAEDLAKILHAQYQVFSTYGEFPNLLFDQGDYYSAEGYATFAAALQDALHQSLSPSPAGEPVMRVFPAWPAAWDAKYQLLAKDGFLVSSSMESGDVQYVEIDSQLGEVARIRNPWASPVVVYRDGVEAEALDASKNDLLELATRPGENLVLVRPGTTPDTYRTSELAVGPLLPHQGAHRVPVAHAFVADDLDHEREGDQRHDRDQGR